MDDVPGTRPDEHERRLRRTNKYCELWAVPLPDTTPDVLLEGALALADAAHVRRRCLVECLVALKGQGLTQHEVFAFADAYELWNELDEHENDLVLDPDPVQARLVQAAWRFERANVLGWALQLVRHLHFPDRPADSGELIAGLVPSLAVATPDVLAPRDPKAIVDAADVANRLALVCAGARTAHLASMPGDLHPGVVYERDQAFRFLTGRSNF